MKPLIDDELHNILACLKARNMTARLNGQDRIDVKPKSKMTEQLAEAIRRSKPRLLWWLKHPVHVAVPPDARGVSWRAWAIQATRAFWEVKGKAA